MPVILCHIMPRSIVSPTHITEANKLMDELAKSKPQVRICETYNNFVTPGGMPKKEEFPDRLHPGPEGYAKWTAALQPIFKDLGLESGAAARRLEEWGQRSIHGERSN
jgi:lysophospholipase L1-like esterase